MSNTRKKLPIGIQTLSEIISGGYYYVDKTGLALRLIENGKYYFLSRPRRFGKSLFLDTLKEIFEANQPLLAGLVVADQWDWSIKHPVIRLNLASAVVENVEDLARLLHQQLEDHERQFDLPARYPDNRSRFADLILRLAQQSGQKVVVLIDEYDKPILDNIDQHDTAQALRDRLRDLYSVIKGQDAHLRFAFLTGVSKFSKVNLFSGLNNLEDITLDPSYSSLCGYTDADVDTVFAAELDGLDRSQIRRWYNGYNWLGTSVYNPFDLLLLFRRRVFKAWWMETGTPTFLTKLLVQEHCFTPDLANLLADESLISSFDIDDISPEALLFQTGYLTIHKVEQLPSGTWDYTLGYPNLEVAVGLNSLLLDRYTDSPRKARQQRAQLERLLRSHDLVGLRTLFQAFFAGSPDRSMPHHWYENNSIARYEGYYASVFYSYFAALGYDCRVEDATNHGRIDMAVLLPDRIYLFEFKVVELLPKGHALAQLQARGYADKYRGHGLPICLIGVEFSRETRNVVGFDSEAIAAG